MTKAPFLWCLQLSPYDAKAGYELLDVICDLTLQANGGQKSPHADLMIAVRYDLDVDMVKARAAGRAFHNVRTLRSSTKKDGWPQGPNAMATDVFRYYAARDWGYSGVFLNEADCVPLCVDFIAKIHAEWSASDKPVLGCHIESWPGGKRDGSQSHINGNMMVAPEFLRAHPEVMIYSRWPAWDAAHQKLFVANSTPSRTIFSSYKLGTDENPWRGCDELFGPVTLSPTHPLGARPYFPAYLHGTKTRDALACVKERLLATSTQSVR